MNSTEWTAFSTLMERPDVVALADRLGADATTPSWIYKFMALTLACSLAEPDGDMGPHVGGYAGSGLCVFYVQEHEDGEPTRRWEPWTCALNLGASLSFVFQCVNDSTQLFNEDDGWQTRPDGTQPGLDELGWQPAVHALLDRSVWRVVNPVDALVQPG